MVSVLMVPIRPRRASVLALGSEAESEAESVAVGCSLERVPVLESVPVVEAMVPVLVLGQEPAPVAVAPVQALLEPPQASAVVPGCSARPAKCRRPDH
jgi:hypothetical protein